MRAGGALQRGLAPAARGFAARGLVVARAAGHRDRRAEQAARPPPLGEEVKYVPPGAGAGLLHESVSGGGGGKPRKRRVALVFGYTGAGYQGSQLHASLEAAHAGAARQAPGDFPARTLEAELMRALYVAGGILPSNYLAEAKLGWRRMSRTDRGVSAMGNVVTVKLLLADGAADAAWEQDPEGLALAAAVNSHLPPAVRVFSVQPVPQSFQPRRLCSARLYKLWVPAEPAGLGCALALDRLRAALRSYEGRRPFHNFTQMKRYGEVAPEGSKGLGATEGMRWLPVGVGGCPPGERGVQAAHYRRVISFECGPPRELVPGSGREFVEVTVKGESFMYNQIRHMVGTALAVSAGSMSLELLECALSEPARMGRLPLAPPETLVLMQSDFPPFRGPGGSPAGEGGTRRLELGAGGLRLQRDFWNSQLAVHISGSGTGEAWDGFFEGLSTACQDAFEPGGRVHHIVSPGEMVRLHREWAQGEAEAGEP